MNRRRLLAAGALLAACSQLRAQGVASKGPIRLVVPTPAGGPSDAAARSLAQVLTRSLGQQVVIDNRPGAGGALAVQALLAASPDGNTLLWTLASMSGLPWVQKVPPYRSIGELAPVSLVGHFVYAMFVHPDLPARSVAEFVAYARGRPDEIRYGTGSLGDYMATTKFLKAAGLRSIRVPYRGGIQALPDLIAGRLQLLFTPLGTGLAQARDGKLRALAVLTPQRSAAMPEVPTLTEAGVAGVTLPSWQAIFAPPGTPVAVTEPLARAIGAALGDAALRSQFDAIALTPEATTPQVLAAMADRDAQVWKSFVAEYEIPLE